MPSDRLSQDRWLLPGLLLLAALLRLTVLERYAIQLDRDIDLYQPMAVAIRDGRGYIHPETGLPTAYRPPLYPVVLSLVLREPAIVAYFKDTPGPLEVFDEDPGRWSGTAIGVLHIFLSIGTVGLTYLTGRRLGLGKWAWLAAGLVSIDPLLLYSVSQVMTETLATFLAAGTLCWLSRWAPLPLPGTATPRRSIFSAVVLGMLFGLCGLCRPTFYAWEALLGGSWILMLIVRLFRREDTDFKPFSARRIIVSMVAVLMGFALAVSPWVLRNVSEFGKPILATTHGGYTLLLSHNPVYYEEVVQRPWGTVWSGASLRQWQRSMEQEMALVSPGIRSDELARDEWMRNRAMKLIESDPWMAIRSGLTLVGRLWNVMPLDSPGSPRRVFRYITGAFYSVWFIVLIVGLFRLSMREWLGWWPGVAMMLSFTAVHFLYWADLRMRAPLVPIMALLAARAFLKRPQPAPVPAATFATPAETQTALATPTPK